MTVNLDELSSQIIEILKPIATSTKENFLKHKEIIIKDAPTDFTSIVTQVDEENDLYLRKKLKNIFPEAGMISEESDDSVSDLEYVWTIDPIDGTFNYSKQIPVYGIIVGLWKNKEPELVVISYPHLDEFLVMSLGAGIILNGEKVYYSKDKQDTIFYADVSKDIEDRQKLERDILQVTKVTPTRVYSSAYITRLFALGMGDSAVIRNAAIWDLVGLRMAVKIRGIKYWTSTENWFNVENISSYDKKILVGNSFFKDKNLLLEL